MNFETTAQTTTLQGRRFETRDIDPINPAFKDELNTLLSNSTGPCVSIYMPTHKAGPEIQQDPIRLSNLLKTSEERLIDFGMRPSEARVLLSRLDRLTRDTFFWRNQADGLVAFISPSTFRTFHLPLHFEELVVVGERFHLKPFLPLLNGDGRFYVLALSQKGVRLIECTRYGLRELDLSGLEFPKNIDEALKYDDMMSKIRFHTRVIGGPQRQRGGMVQGRGPAIRDTLFRGHGTGIDDNKTDILRYLIKVDDGLQEILKEEQAPLVLAGVDYLLPLYMEASSYRYIWDEGITGNPDGIDSKELHEQAWAMVGPHFRQTQEDAVARYLELTGTGLASDDTREVVFASYFGKVDTLFVALGQYQWGSFNPETDELSTHDKPGPGDNDLMDLAAMQTFLNGGIVYAVEPGEVPGGAGMAAIFRY